ncbi:topology modulation protein [Streptomyces sp. B1866]|uniref:topology modulation protein n=1 Tax=Streptomyces sp. B1866 TaxID=3075431 RepID=UPI00288FA36B|nr:topology modulation protein [Streptomyces sp. B1866]MDT3397625.1 topology modulation protein [Streptomyces sp. B1866]
MKKVAIVGCGGSGKSYVARELGRFLGAPVTHLDAVYYDDGWNPLPKEDFAARQRGLVAVPAWVIDGNHNSTLRIRLEACDTVVFMDLPTLTCLWGVLTRQLRHGRGQNQETGVYNRIHWGVIRYVWSYRRAMRPRVLRKIDEFARDHAEVVLLRSRRQARRWLRERAAALR